MADALKRLIGPVALTTSAVTEYTVPGGTTTTLRDVHVCNETATAQTFTMSIGADGAGKRLFAGHNVPANSVYQYTGSIVLTAAEIVQAYASAGAALTLVVSGVEST